MKDINHLGTINEIRKEFDKTIAFGCREDRWYMLLGGNKDITNVDVIEVFSIFAKYTITAYEKGGNDTDEAIGWMIDFLEECKKAGKKDE